ncbi:proline dehydrogenase [Bacillus sp. 7586-K]|uniref:proline dehydrogenase n=2 Tax=Bacillaceae TaxID=186817 RepID=A0ABT9Z0F2_9BACI|nr:proline dehydrogenase [Metabacillus niabensis]MDQ0225454.1 proline dehydrogenase [Metabacillus niabensis]PAD71022.1 proline dehydrogenase [Bacillus sp. 7586-K]
MEKILRNSFMFLSRNKMMTKLAKRYGLRFGASRFVAGDTIDHAINVIKELNSKGLDVTLDYLGEFIEDVQEANEMADNCIKAIEAIGNHRLQSQVSLKLTSMGLDISEEVVLQNMRRILTAAKRHQIFVTIDMEDYSRCEKTLEIFKTLRREYTNIGTVLQAYLYRTVKDIEELNEYNASLRLVKGAYKESHKVAFPEKKTVDKNYMQIIKMHLLNGNFTAVATHDDAIIQYTKTLVKTHRIPLEQFEFQMLYGIRPEKQLEIVKEGYKMRVYVPYGTDWYGYFMRRLAERPANVAFVLKGMFRK